MAEPAGVSADHIEARSARLRLAGELRTVKMVAQRELIRLARNRGRLLAGLIQPLAFLFLLGFGLGRLVDPAGDDDFVRFILPGVIAMSVVTSALLGGVSVVWDREFGFLREMLVAPAHRALLVAGKIVGGAAVAVVQGAFLLVLAPVVGVTLTAWTVVGAIGIAALIATMLTAFGVFLAVRIRKLESFQAVIQLFLMPMIFLSGAFFPLRDLPGWLTVLTHLNPLTYAVDALRQVMVADPDTAERFATGLELFGRQLPVALQLAVVAGFTVLFMALSVGAFGKPE